MNATEARSHMEEIKNYLGLLLFHQQTLLREIELLRPKFESNIVQPKISNVRNITANDLDIDVVQIGNANKEVIEARKAYYYASIDLASTVATIAAQKDLYNSYKAHVAQEINKQATPCTNEMIYSKLKEAKNLKNLSSDEEKTLNTITDEIPKALNSGKEARIRLYETLQNFILQHGK
jgi:hypothetical protein